MKHWAQHGTQSLHDKLRCGRPSTLGPEERDLALHYLKEEPHALTRVMKRFADKTDKRLSLSSLKRLAKKARLRWKRVRKSLKSLRDPDAFAQAKRELEVLQKQEDQGQIALYYFEPKLLPTGFLEIEVPIEAGGDDKERHLQLKALRGDRMNRLR